MPYRVGDELARQEHGRVEVVADAGQAPFEEHLVDELPRTGCGCRLRGELELDRTSRCRRRLGRLRARHLQRQQCDVVVVTPPWRRLTRRLSYGLLQQAH